MGESHPPLKPSFQELLPSKADIDGRVLAAGVLIVQKKSLVDKFVLYKRCEIYCTRYLETMY